jgi:predicted ATPase
MSKPSILAEPVLVGREKELEKLQEFLSSTISGKGKTVFVSGEAGSGKTRLIKEFLTLVKDQGLAVLTGWCLSNAAVPYFPFFEAFEHFFINEQTEDDGPFNTGDLQKSPMTEVRDLDLTSWLTRPTQTQKQGGSRLISAQVWKDQTFAAVSRTLESIARSETVILFIDDLQWADSASLSLLHYLSRSVSSEKIMLLATFRSEQLNVDTEGRPSSLLETLRLMRREELFEEIKLLPLTRESVTTTSTCTKSL